VAGQEQPIHVLMVDLCGSPDYLDLIKAGLLAAIEAMPPTAHVGLLTYSDRIGMYDLRSYIPHVRYMPIPPGAEVCSMRLSELLPLEGFLVELEGFKDAIRDAIDSLEVVPCGDDVRCHPELHNVVSPNRRGFGAAMQAVVECFVEEASTCVHVVSFLSGVLPSGPQSAQWGSDGSCGRPTQLWPARPLALGGAFRGGGGMTDPIALP
jgi:hypothetical protein